MGQTLTHGVYLPDEGERNCYSGLAANWSILDGAVGTIAEHTSQIAGKAPAVHTHGKADVTDLFNSANVWTANNTYSANCIIYNSDNSGSIATLRLRNSKAEVLSTGNTASDQSITFRDKNDVTFCHVRGAVQSNGVALKIGAYAKDSSNNTVNTELQLLAYTNGNKAIFPSTTDAYDLGSSGYQWNNLYAKNYYYNGTAWGLDKANEWTGSNTFSKASKVSDITNAFQEQCTMVFSQNHSTIFFNTRGSSNYKTYGTFLWAGYGTGSSPERYAQIQLLRSIDKYGDTDDGLKPDTSFKLLRIAIHFKILDMMEAVRVTNDGAENSLKPITNNATDLGTSDNKWKTLNGINPGALSLPKIGTTANTDYIDVSGNIDLSTTASQTFTAPATGWFCISFKYNEVTSCRISAYNMRADCVSIGSDGFAGCYIPVTEGVTVTVRVNATAIYNARIYLCQGNV